MGGSASYREGRRAAQQEASNAIQEFMEKANNDDVVIGLLEATRARSRNGILVTDANMRLFGGSANYSDMRQKIMKLKPKEIDKMLEQTLRPGVKIENVKIRDDGTITWDRVWEVGGKKVSQSEGLYAGA